MKRSPAVDPRGHGFTLIEVLVALAIVAMGMAAVLGAMTSSASTIVYMRDKTLAQWIALNHIAEERLKMTPGQAPQKGNSDGDLDYAGQKWHWRQEIVPTAVQGMVRMDVMVRPADVKGDDKTGWYITLSGIMGDAISAPRGDMPLWGSGTTAPGPGQPGSNAATPGQNGNPPLPNGQVTPPGGPTQTPQPTNK